MFGEVMGAKDASECAPPPPPPEVPLSLTCTAAFVRAEEDTCAIGRSGCVQHFPWSTHWLQNPHSPSLHVSHRQNQSSAYALQFAQKAPERSRVAGSSVVIARRSLPADG